jgi:toxin ParE1/3/4
LSQRTWTQSRLATEDLREISRYTVAQWGRAQAKTYLSGIRVAIDRIAVDPSIQRRSISEIPGYFRLTVGSHVVFYREAESTIHVVRTLHQRMDFDSHLP